MAAALSNHADEIYDALPDDRHRPGLREVFKTLTEKGADNRGIRRPTRLAQLHGDRQRRPRHRDHRAGRIPQGGVTFLMPGTDLETG